jgi:RNA-dependent RNA polymerase
LDGAKTGLKILPETLLSDLKEYHHARGPQWKDKAKGSKKDGPLFDKSNSNFLSRGKGPFIKGKFIMDILLSAAKKECDQALAQLEIVFAPLTVEVDPHLTQPWNDAVAMASRGSPEAVKRKRMDLSIIAVHVHEMYKEHKALGGKAKAAGGTKGAAFTDQPIEIRQDFLRAMSKKFHASPTSQDMHLDSMMDNAMIARLRASYAYCHDSTEMQKRSGRGWSRFPWNVAMRELSTIKASALGPHKTITNGFYERLKLVSGRRS